MCMSCRWLGYYRPVKYPRLVLDRTGEDAPCTHPRVGDTNACLPVGYPGQPEPYTVPAPLRDQGFADDEMQQSKVRSAWMFVCLVFLCALVFAAVYDW